MSDQPRRLPVGPSRGIHLRSPGRILLLIALIVLMLATHGRIFHPAYRVVTLSRELLRLRRQSEQLTKQNKELEEAAAYLDTAAGQELAARSELGALKPGERLIITSPSEKPSPVPSVSLSQLVDDYLTRGYVLLSSATGYITNLARCVAGIAGDASATPTAIPAAEKGKQ